MSIFQFKKFSVLNDQSAMKVNTDGVLLAAVASIKGNESELLDVGTGTGTIALILAQRLEELGHKDFIINGIDIDKPSFEEATINFQNSPWKNNLKAINIDLNSYKPKNNLDLIVSNPPYYEDSLKNPSQRYATARHTSSIDEENLPNAPLSYRTLIVFAKEYLKPDGRIAMILPADKEKDLVRYAGGFGLYPYNILRIKTLAAKKPSRIIAEFSRQRLSPTESDLAIRDSSGYTADYLKLVNDIYLWVR